MLDGSRFNGCLPWMSPKLTAAPVKGQLERAAMMVIYSVFQFFCDMLEIDVVFVCFLSLR